MQDLVLPAALPQSQQLCRAATRGTIGALSAQVPQEHALKRSNSLPCLPSIKGAGACVAPREGGPPKEGIYSRRWAGENQRLLHQQRERQWLRTKGKHSYIDFSDVERAELRRYFDALATSSKRIGMDRLENMLISLGLASTRKEVRKIVDAIDSNGNGELDFEEYLEIFRTRTDSEIFQVFKAMMEGRLGDRNLNFQTVISTYRRNLFMDATGATTMRPVRLPSDNVPAEQGAKILQNFSALQRSRYIEAEAAFEAGGPPVDKYVLPFNPTGSVPPGGLGMVWRGVTAEYSLVSSRPSSADRSRRTLGTPLSPRTVLEDIVKVSKPKKKTCGYGSTIVIYAPALEEGAGRLNKEMSTTWSTEVP